MPLLEKAHSEINRYALFAFSLLVCVSDPAPILILFLYRAPNNLSCFYIVFISMKSILMRS